MLFVQALILFHWKGNLTHESITMKVFSDNKTSNLYLYNNEISREIELDKSQYPIIIQLKDLKPETTYYYYFDNSQRTQLKPYDFDNQNGFFQFTTFGLSFEPFSFNFSLSACARTQSTSRVFYDIHQDHPSFFLQLGDLHYSNIKVPSFDDFDFAYKQVFASTTQRYLQMQYSYLRYQQTPIEYQFDDHDYGANDADSTSPTREVANLMYWRYVPHANHHNTMPLFNVSGIQEIDQISQITEENIGAYRYRIIGRTILIVLDLRTFSNAKTMLGDKQKLWLYSLLENLKTQINIKAIILASSVNFHGQSWYEYPNEQYQVADYLSDLQQNYDKKVLIVSSDSHSTAFYNGNGLFIGNLSSKYNKGIIEAMSGSLDKPGSCKFRKVTFGPWLGPGHFTNVKVIDDGVNVYFFITAYKGREILYTFNQSDRGSQDIQSDNECPMTPIAVISWTVIMLVVSIVGVGLILLMVNFIHNRRMRITMDLEKSKQLK